MKKTNQIGCGLLLMGTLALWISVGISAAREHTRDTDSDGLSDIEEAAAGTDSRNADSDADGLDDARELAWSTDPNDPDSRVDLERELIARLDGEQRGELSRRELSLPETTVSVAAWVQLSPGANGVIASQGSYSLAVVDSHLVFQVSMRGEMWPLIAPSAIPEDGEWHWVAGAFDGTALRLYLDGAAPIAIAHPDSGPIDASDEPLVVGDVSGSVADVRVYARALQDGEVLLLGELTANQEETR